MNGGRKGGPERTAEAPPKRTLRVADAVAITVGLVVGAGIFRVPSLVAANAGSDAAVLAAWVLGGAVSLLGALCYAELAATYPRGRGDYYYLSRALGSAPAFLFGWARLTVVHTGSIALLAFVFGDYATQLLPLGRHSSALYAALVVIAATAANALGLEQGKWTQNVLTLLEVMGLLLIVAVGFFVAGPAPAPAAGGAQAASHPATAWGLVMVLVLLTYGGWNEAAYVTAELHRPERNIVRALVWSVVLITVLYLLVNVVYLRVLGRPAMGASQAVASDLMGRALGPRGGQLISVLIVISTLTSINATVLTGARTNHAFGRDSRVFAGMGQWNGRRGAPIKALLLQGTVALALVLFGAWTRRGFQTMVEYTAPVFWLFFGLSVASLFVLRARSPARYRPFSVPGYPVTPLLFCAACAYLFFSSVAYAGPGALAGVAVLASGLVFLLFERRSTLFGARHRPQEVT